MRSVSSATADGTLFFLPFSEPDILIFLKFINFANPTEIQSYEKNDSLRHCRAV